MNKTQVSHRKKNLLRDVQTLEGQFQIFYRQSFVVGVATQSLQALVRRFPFGFCQRRRAVSQRQTIAQSIAQLAFQPTIRQVEIFVSDLR